MMRLSDHLAASRVIELEGLGKDEVLRELVDAVAGSPAVRDPALLLRAVVEREGILSTGIGLGIAVPHAKLRSVDDFVIAVGVSREGVDFDALDLKPAHIVVLIAAPEGRQRDYLSLLAQVTVTLKDAEVRERIIASAAEPAVVHRILGSGPGRGVK
jgi:PTS system nitrogen regulatory IIA component